MFTSNFSVNEFALSKQSKLVPLGQVMGNSAYCLNLSVFNQRIDTGEIKALTRPLLEVYLKALYSMQQDAKQRQAHAVIGVRLEQTRKYKRLWTPKNVLEVKAIGTAVSWEVRQSGSFLKSPIFRDCQDKSSMRFSARVIIRSAWF